MKVGNSPMILLISALCVLCPSVRGQNTAAGSEKPKKAGSEACDDVFTITKKAYEVSFDIAVGENEASHLLKGFLEDNKKFIGDNKIAIFKEFIKQKDNIKNLNTQTVFEKIAPTCNNQNQPVTGKGNCPKQEVDKLISYIKNNGSYSGLDVKLNETKKEVLDCTVLEVKQAISKDMTKILNQVQKHYENLESEESRSLIELITTLDKAIVTLSRVLIETKSNTKPLRLLNSIEVFTADLLIEPDTKIVKEIKSYATFMDMAGEQFFQEIDDGFKDIAKYLYDSHRWYFFLKMLKKWFGKYETMKNMGNYQNAGKAILAQIRRGVAKKSDVTQLLTTVDKLPQQAFKDLLGDLNPGKAKMNHLGSLVERMFSIQMDVQCTAKATTCKGSYVLLSSCLTKLCPGTQAVRVFATNRFYLDEDVNGKRKLSSMIILAPLWHIVGKRTISMNGMDGPPHSPPKATSSDVEDGRGTNGKPGLPGFSAGNFFGVAEIVDGENLIIESVGGHGGVGQDGGDGGPGGVPSFNAPPDSNTPQVIVNQILNCRNCIYRVTHGYIKGGPGGNGGVGGMGGLPGSITLIYNKDKDNIVTKIQNGNPGKGGKGGLGGMGRYMHWGVRNAYLTKGEVVEVVKGEDRFTERNGDKGADNSFTNGRSAPEKTNSKENYPLIVNEYTFFVRARLDGKTNNLRSVGFLDYIEKHKSINSLYDTYAYGDAYKNLERQSRQIKDKLIIVRSLDSLLRRIEVYLSVQTLGKEDKKVLTYIYTAILGKLLAQRNNEKFVVVNPTRYLDSILKMFDRLRDLKNIANVKSYEESYLRDVLESTKQAEILMNKEIIPTLDSYQDKLNDEINNLAREVVKLKEDVKTERDALQRKRDQLRNTVIWRKATVVLAVAMSLASFGGPVSMVVAMGVFAAAKIAETLLTSDEGTDASHAMATIPAVIDENLNKVFENLQRLKKHFNQQLSEAENRLGKLGSNPEFEKIKNKVKETKATLAGTDPKSLDPKTAQKINKLRNDLVTLLSEEMQRVKVTKQANSDDLVKKLQLIETVLTMPDVPPKKEGESKEGTGLMSDSDLKEVGEQIKKNSETFRQLDVYQDRIYTQMLPMINEISSNMKGLAKANKGQSQAYLQISQWKTQDYLIDMMGTLGKLTKGFEANEEFEYILNKCLRGTKTMLTVFQRIADNQDKAGLAVFLGSITHQKTASTQLTRPDLQALVTDMETSIQNNLILESFERGHNIFLQSFFPFGTDLAKTYNLPSMAALGNSTEKLVAFTKQQTMKMIENIKASKSTITKYDGDIFKENPFEKGFTKLFPAFYTWKYEKNQRAISLLLEGKNVEMDADIMAASAKMAKRNAVKFNDIRLGFVPRDNANVKLVQDAMNKLTVVLKTLGTFQYQCGGKYYIVNNDLFEVQLSYMEDETDDDYFVPVDPNAVWLKIKENTPIFSPYSTWNITLKSEIGEDPKAVLKALNGIKMDVQLYGYGSYVKDGSQICNENLDLIYDRDPRNMVAKEEIRYH